MDAEGAESLVDWTKIPASVTKLVLELHPNQPGYGPRSMLGSLETAGFRCRFHAKREGG